MSWYGYGIFKDKFDNNGISIILLEKNYYFLKVDLEGVYISKECTDRFIHINSNWNYKIGEWGIYKPHDRIEWMKVL